MEMEGKDPLPSLRLSKVVSRWGKQNMAKLFNSTEKNSKTDHSLEPTCWSGICVAPELRCKGLGGKAEVLMSSFRDWIKNNKQELTKKKVFKDSQ